MASRENLPNTDQHRDEEEEEDNEAGGTPGPRDKSRSRIRGGRRGSGRGNVGDRAFSRYCARQHVGRQRRASRA